MRNHCFEADKLVKHNLCTVGKVSKLRLPERQSVRLCKKYHTRSPRQRIQRASIDDFIAFLTPRILWADINVLRYPDLQDQNDVG